MIANPGPHAVEFVKSPLTDGFNPGSGRTRSLRVLPHSRQDLRDLATLKALPGMLQGDAQDRALALGFLGFRLGSSKHRDWPNKRLHVRKAGSLDLGEGNLSEGSCTTPRCKLVGILGSRVVLPHELGPLEFRDFRMVQFAVFFAHG